MLFPVTSLLLAALVVTTEAIRPRQVTSGFIDPVIVHSAGKKASCVTGKVMVAVTATNQKLLYSGPANQFAATETIQELLQANPTIFNATNGGPSVVSGTFQIWSKLCVPADPSVARKVRTLQFLTHGATLDSGFWDLAPGYSYVDAAAEAGYATFSYDRLGTGKSDHPDPIQIVQSFIQVEIAHILVQLIRTARIGGRSFEAIVGVGHSAGATITQAVTAQYPRDFDAAILTGTSANPNYVSTAVAAFNLIIANKDPSRRFAGLANGYLTQGTVQGFQFAFYRYPYFDPQILQLDFERRETNTLGELFTLAGIVRPAPQFTGPVDVVLGERDFVFCGADCTFPVDQAVLYRNTFYPAAGSGSRTYLVPDAGHNFVAHFSAPKAFAQMIAFLKANGIY